MAGAPRRIVERRFRVPPRVRLRLSGYKMAIKDRLEEAFDWNVDVEVQLFYAMRGHKPVGVNRHFQMACIMEKFRNSIQKDISSQQIWDHLETMYDMAALDESEILPFPNDEMEFLLPETDFGQLMKKDKKDVDDSPRVRETSKTKDERPIKDEKETKDNKEVEVKEKEKPSKPGKGKHHVPQTSEPINEEKETPSKASPAKPVQKEKMKEVKEKLKDVKEKLKEVKEAESAENSPKRKRATRATQEQNSKPSSPSTKEPPAKRRRNL